MAKGKNGKSKHGEANRSVLFAKEYLVDLNATQAAIRAGYSENGASQTAGKLMAKPDVKAIIEEGMRSRANRVEITADAVLREIANVAFFDIGALFDNKGELIQIGQIAEANRRAVHSIETQELFEGFGKDRIHVGYTKKIKACDKMKALELLCKHLGLLTEKLEVSTLKPFIIEKRDGSQIIMGIGDPNKHSKDAS